MMLLASHSFDKYLWNVYSLWAWHTVDLSARDRTANYATRKTWALPSGSTPSAELSHSKSRQQLGARVVSRNSRPVTGNGCCRPETIFNLSPKDKCLSRARHSARPTGEMEGLTRRQGRLRRSRRLFQASKCYMCFKVLKTCSKWQISFAKPTKGLLRNRARNNRK